MNAANYWQLFLETGAPEMYLLYQNARKMEMSNVPYNTRSGASGHSLQ